MRARKGKRISKKPSQFGLWAATRPHEVGVASNRGSACRGEYVPGPCTHRPSHHGSWEHPKGRCGWITSFLGREARVEEKQECKRRTVESEPERIPGRPQRERSRKAERECGRRSRNRPAAEEASAEARAKERQNAARSREELTEGQDASIKQAQMSESLRKISVSF